MLQILTLPVKTPEPWRREGYVSIKFFVITQTCLLCHPQVSYVSVAEWLFSTM